MALIQEERRSISQENENLHLQIQELIGEIERYGLNIYILFFA
jgi:hypothetical protein